MAEDSSIDVKADLRSLASGKKKQIVSRISSYLVQNANTYLYLYGKILNLTVTIK